MTHTYGYESTLEWVGHLVHYHLRIERLAVLIILVIQRKKFMTYTHRHMHDKTHSIRFSGMFWTLSPWKMNKQRSIAMMCHWIQRLLFANSIEKQPSELKQVNITQLLSIDEIHRIKCCCIHARNTLSLMDVSEKPCFKWCSNYFDFIHINLWS